MIEIVDWNTIRDTYHRGTLLLGNGSSIAVNECFSYDSLYDEACRLKYISEQVQQVFDEFGVSDFELVLRRLWQAKKVNEALGVEPGRVEEAYSLVRKALINTVRDVHVSYEEASPHLESIYRYMMNFDTVISLNYDLIVYWAAQLSREELGVWFKDCFNKSEFRSDWADLREPYRADGTTLFFYPHGNLVLRRKGFAGTRKIATQNRGNLLDAILNEWEEEQCAPVFICEGTTDKKQQSIASSDYLEKVFYEVLPSMSETLVIYGWSLGDQDIHLLRQIRKSAVQRAAVSIYGGDQVLAGNIERQLTEIGVEEIVFFDSTSEGCWNNGNE